LIVAATHDDGRRTPLMVTSAGTAAKLT